MVGFVMGAGLLLAVAGCPSASPQTAELEQRQAAFEKQVATVETKLGQLEKQLAGLEAKPQSGPAVDAPPFGGGAGMVLQAGPLVSAVDSVANASSGSSKPHVILMSAQGRPLTHRRAAEISQMEAITLVCGHYEGVDERFIELRVDEEISIGDFVMTGGEIPAMALTDAVVRLIPGVLGDAGSSEHDSFARGTESLMRVVGRSARLMVSMGNFPRCMGRLRREKMLISSSVGQVAGVAPCSGAGNGTEGIA